MKQIEILESFETEIGKINDTLNKPNTDESLYWINLAIVKFVKLRFNGDSVHKTGYEETEKRRTDLQKLLKTFSVSYEDDDAAVSKGSYDYVTVTYPPAFMYSLSEAVLITDTNDENSYITSVFECTQDSFMYRVTNSLTDFHYRNHKARPIRIRTAGGCQLLTDTKYKIKEYYLTYISTPTEVSLANPFEEYTDFDDATMYEIIKIAALMFLENTNDQRYQTITSEVMSQE